jgi:thioredoxin 1
MENLMGSITVDVTDATFDAVVRKSDKTVVVDFWATWCGPCKMVAPVLEEIACEYPEQLTVAKVDVDANSATALAHHIRSIPTIIVFRAGEPVQHIVGARTKAELLSDLAGYLPATH